jgi:hypothetical protein
VFEPHYFFGPSVLLVGPSPVNCAATEFEAFLRLGGSLILRYTPPAKYEGIAPTVRVRYGTIERILPAIFDEDVAELRVI